MISFGEELKQVVDQACKDAKGAGIDGPINWAALYCCDVLETKSLLFGDSNILIQIRKASPEGCHQFKEFVMKRILEKWPEFTGFEITTEW